MTTDDRISRQPYVALLDFLGEFEEAELETDVADLALRAGDHEEEFFGRKLALCVGWPGIGSLKA